MPVLKRKTDKIIRKESLKNHTKYKAYKQSRHTSVLILLFNRLIVTKVFDGLHLVRFLELQSANQIGPFKC